MSSRRLVEIEPKQTYLSSEQLITQRHAYVEPPRSGLKRTQNDGSKDEVEELKIAYANLRAQLAVSRIERLAGRTIAVWHVEQQSAEVLHKDGKFESFGYSQCGKLFLEYYEALFLLELGRLQLEFNGMIVSIEQAYYLLLGEAASEKYNKYLVYSALSRVGYIVVRHQQAECNATTITSEQCIWALLQECISNIPVPGHIKRSPVFAKTQASMETIKQQIMCQLTPNGSQLSDTESTNFIYEVRKRKGEPISDFGSKKPCTSRQISSAGSSLVDFLKTEPSYLKFQSVFQKFDLIVLQSTEFSELNEDAAVRYLDIDFDLHLHNEGFKKHGSKLPSFSVVILDANQSFPTHNDIAKYHYQQRRIQKHTIPLLVVSVSESKQIQAFLYYIS